MCTCIRQAYATLTILHLSSDQRRPWWWMKLCCVDNLFSDEWETDERCLMRPWDLIRSNLDTPVGWHYFRGRVAKYYLYEHTCKCMFYSPNNNLEGVRWIQNPLATPGSACLPPTRRIFFLGVFADGKKTSGSACIDASRLIFQSAVSFQTRLVAKPTRLFLCIPAVKPSESTERTLTDISIHVSYPLWCQFTAFKLSGAAPVQN